MHVSERFGDLFLTDFAEFGCPYFQDGRIARVELVYPFEDQARQYNSYLAEGFCRSGSAWFANRCPGCNACVPYRVPTDGFRMTRSQKRVWKRNAGVKVELVRSSSLDQEKVELFGRYKEGRHPGTLESSVLEEAAQAHYGYPGTFQLLYLVDGKLAAVSVLDDAADSLSAHCFYHDPAYAQLGLGTYSVLYEIRLAAELHKRWYYLGFYIEGVGNMRYKGRFGPAEVLGEGGWKKFPGMGEDKGKDTI